MVIVLILSVTVLIGPPPLARLGGSGPTRILSGGRAVRAALRIVAVAISGLSVLASLPLLTAGNTLAQVTSGETWAYDPNTNTWTDVTVTSPSGRFRPAMAYDAQSDRVVLFGGESYHGGVANDETWAFDLNAVSPPSSRSSWTRLLPSVAPSSRTGHTMAYDPGSDRVVLFGGRTGRTAVGDDTWAYDVDTNTWTRMNPATTPSARFGHSMVYVPGLNRTVLFGGFDAAERRLNEMWAYDISAETWTEMAPSVRPLQRAGHAMAYDESSGKLVLFGGDSGVGVFSDETWAYDIQSENWVRMDPATKPSPRGRHDMAYVSAVDRIVLFGGCISGACEGVVGDTWLYDVDSDAWNRMDPASSPSARFGHRMTYDKESDRVVLTGGAGADSTLILILVVAGVAGAAVAVVVAALLFRRRKRRSMADKERVTSPPGAPRRGAVEVPKGSHTGRR